MGAAQMDLDMLLYGDLVVDEPGLTLPRPDLSAGLHAQADGRYRARSAASDAGRTMRELWQGFDPPRT